MKKILFIFLILFAPNYLFAQGKTDSSNDTLSYNTLFDPVSDTIIDINIFESNTPLKISLDYDITSFIKNKVKSDYQDAVFRIHYENNKVVSKNIRLKARGNFRKKECFFPPIHLNFKSDPLENIGLEGKIKLVTHCSDSKAYKNYILREYLVYKLYQVLTDYSFRVRLLDITYTDTGKKQKKYQRYGFIIEPLELVGKRMESVEINPDFIRKENVIEIDADRVALFQYMIGNTDWRIKGGHNTKYLKSLNIVTQKTIPVPYDFDFSGFVGTSYSFPQSWTSVENVKEREYLGYCRESDEEYYYTIDIFQKKKEEIMETISTFEIISEREKERLIKYIEGFYSRISNPDRFINTLKRECRDDF